MNNTFLKIVMSKVPIFVILGSTGTGKSKLGIEIAKKFNGEIISADSMQVYKGLDVITNKVTEEEAEGVPHHMLDFLDPNTRFTVVDFRNQALRHIDAILQRNKVPVIVGGTNYYIESLLWTILVDNKTNINDQGDFSLYHVDKIGSSKHSQEVLESLWKIDNEERTLNRLFKDDVRSDLEKEHDQSETVTEAKLLNEVKSNTGEKRVSDDRNDKMSRKKIKKDDEDSPTEHTEISSHFQKVKEAEDVFQMISKDNTLNAIHADSSTNKTDQQCQTETKAVERNTASPSHKVASTSSPETELPKINPNREGVKSLVTVLDSLRDKLIKDIEVANRVSLSYRTLKDLIKQTPDENQYEKEDFKCTNVKEMFEELDGKIDQMEGDVKKSENEEMQEKTVGLCKEAPHQSIASLYPHYKSACTKLTELFKHQTLLPKHFLYCLSIHQKAKPMQEKLGLYGLTPKELKDHLRNLNETWSHLEVGVRKIFPEKTKHLGLEAPASASGLSLDNLFTSAPGEQFATLLKQFEYEIIRLNSLIARNVERFNTSENDLPHVSSALTKSTSLLRNIFERLNHTRNHSNDGTRIHLTDSMKYYLPTDFEKTNLSPDNLHRMLQEVDRGTALNLHPNNRRKTVRALHVFYEQGRTLHDIISEQKSLEGGSMLGGPLRFPNTVILWLQCDKPVLDKRLETRVHSMIQNGLVSELLEFHRQYNEERLKKQLEPDYTKGIFQSIGFKEFHSYLILPESERNTDKGQRLFAECVKSLVLANVQYARRQNQWVRNRLLKCPDRAVPPVYSLNCTDLSTWPQTVSEPALHIVESYLTNRTPEIEPLAKVFSDPSYYNTGTYPCDVCSRVFVGKHQYDQHMVSYKHRKMVARIERQLKLARRLVNQQTIAHGEEIKLKSSDAS